MPLMAIMNDVIVVALIGAAASIAGSIMSMLVSAKKAKEQAGLTLYRIDQLEKKVQQHNNLVERTYRLEEHFRLTDEKIKVVNHRISDLEKGRDNHE